MSDRVNHPTHYNNHPSGVEAIDVCEHLTFNIGNAVKYVMRHAYKGSSIEDLKKARWYIERELARENRTSHVFNPKMNKYDNNLLENIRKIIEVEPNEIVNHFFFRLSRIVMGHEVDSHLIIMMEAMDQLIANVGESV